PEVFIGSAGASITLTNGMSGLSAEWREDPADAGRNSYEWAIGRGFAGIDFQDWTDVGTSTSAYSGLSLWNGATYVVSVRAVFPDGTRGEVGVSPPMLVDQDSPGGGYVNDGPDSDNDWNFQVSSTTVSATWSGFSDGESGIREYEWAIGTSLGGTEIQGFTTVGLALTATNTGLSLG